MALNITVPTSETPDLRPRITVIGCGGAGGNAVNNMIDADLQGVDFVVANTDSQSLAGSKAERRIQLGAGLTQGLGAGARPDVGRAAAEEALEDIHHHMQGSNMAFIAAGMGGGTGTGAAPVIAKAAKDMGVLTVGVVTKPFQFEGVHRMRIAEEGIEDLAEHVDTLIVIPNQNLFRIANEKTTFADAFKMADDVLYSGVRGVTDLMVMPGLINLDFADVRAVMSEMGKAMMGTGEAEGERRSLDAAEAAIANPLLDDTSMKGAKGVLINITGGPDMTLFEVDEAANRIRAEVDNEAYIIFGSAFDDALEGKVRVSVVATGIDALATAEPLPTKLRVTEPEARSIPVIETAPEPELIDDAPAVAETVSDDEPADADIPAEAAQVDLEEALVEGDAADTEAPADVEAATDDQPVADATPATPDTPAAAAETADAEPKHEGARGTLDAFIPPKPAVAEKAAPDGEKTADPFAAAAMANGGRDRGEGVAAGPAKPTSLFDRVTRRSREAFGLNKPKVVETPASDADVDKPAGPISAPAAQRPSESPKPRVVSGGGGAQAQELGGLDPQDRLAPAEEDDLLEIPAFLRRQAN
jgi:cell division protein FtsZ